MMVNNINKSASAKILQPEWETGLRTSKKPADFLIRALRVCERATLESRKGHSYMVEKPLCFDPFGQTGLLTLAII